jgi:hypothetical protein
MFKTFLRDLKLVNNAKVKKLRDMMKCTCSTATRRKVRRAEERTTLHGKFFPIRAGRIACDSETAVGSGEYRIVYNGDMTSA